MNATHGRREDERLDAAARHEVRVAPRAALELLSLRVEHMRMHEHVGSAQVRSGSGVGVRAGG